jgi:hypothetical protein
LFAQDDEIEIEKSYDKFNKLTTLKLKDYIKLESDLPGVQNVWINWGYAYKDQDTSCFIEIEIVSSRIIYIMKDNLIKFIADTSNFSIKAYSNSKKDILAVDLWREWAIYYVDKDFFNLISNCKKIELRIEGYEGYRDCKFDKESKKILNQFTKKYL